MASPLNSIIIEIGPSSGLTPTYSPNLYPNPSAT